MGPRGNFRPSFLTLSGGSLVPAVGRWDDDDDNDDEILNTVMIHDIKTTVRCHVFE